MLLYPLGGWCPFFFSPWLARVKPRGTENIGMGLCNTVWDSAVRSTLSPSNPEESHRESFSDVMACEDFVYPARGQKIMTSFSLGGLLFFFSFFFSSSEILWNWQWANICLYRTLWEDADEIFCTKWWCNRAFPIELQHPPFLTVNRQHEQPEPAMLGQLGRVY